MGLSKVVDGQVERPVQDLDGLACEGTFSVVRRREWGTLPTLVAVDLVAPGSNDFALGLLP